MTWRRHLSTRCVQLLHVHITSTPALQKSPFYTRHNELKMDANDERCIIILAWWWIYAWIGTAGGNLKVALLRITNNHQKFGWQVCCKQGQMGNFRTERKTSSSLQTVKSWECECNKSRQDQSQRSHYCCVLEIYTTNPRKTKKKTSIIHCQYYTPTWGRALPLPENISNSKPSNWSVSIICWNRGSWQTVTKKVCVCVGECVKRQLLATTLVKQEESLGRRQISYWQARHMTVSFAPSVHVCIFTVGQWCTGTFLFIFTLV